MTARQVIDIALGEAGYVESPANSNRTKYGAWYGLDGQPWCMIFVQWCFNEAGSPLPYKTASCSDLERWYRRNKPDAVYATPEAGDIVIYSFGHTGIVLEHGGGYLTAVEGNTSPDSLGSQSEGGGVYKRRRPESAARAFIRPEFERGIEKMDVEALSTQELLRLWERISGALSRLEPGEWSKTARAWAEIAGAIEGDSDGNMAYRRPATREELAQMFYNIFGRDSE